MSDFYSERAALIAELGWAPEERTAAGRYAATTGELVKWVREQRAIEAGAPTCPHCGRIGYLVRPGQWTTGCCCAE